MSTDTDQSDATDELAPDDPVGNDLCDALCLGDDGHVKRVLDWYIDDAESDPDWLDIRQTLDRCETVVAVWEVDYGAEVRVRAGPAIGTYEQCYSRLGGHYHTTRSGETVERLVDRFGLPELVHLDTVNVTDGDDGA